MNEVELQRMVVRLVGDASSFQRMASESTAAAQQTAANVQSAAKQIEALQGSVKGFASQALSTLGMLGVATSLKGAFDKFSEFERNSMRLKAAIEANGQAAEPVIEDYNRFAKSISDSTLMTKGAVMSLLSHAEAQGLSGDAAKRAATNAVALAGATGHEADQMLRAAIMLEQGHVEMAKHMLHLRGVRNETELVSMVQQRLTSGMAIAQAELETTSGKIQKLQKSLGGLSKDIGALVAEAVRPFVDKLTEIVKWFNELDPLTKRIVVVVLTLTAALLAVGPAMATIGPVVAAMLGPVRAVLSLLFSLATPWTVLIGAVGFVIAGVKMLLAGVLLLLNPFTLVAGAVAAVKAALVAAAAAVGLLFSPLGLVVGLLAVAAVAASAWVRQVGGLAAAWGIVKDYASKAWELIRGAASTAIGWLIGKWNQLLDAAVPMWEAVQRAALQAWDWITLRVQEFVAWVTPAWNDVSTFLRRTWLLVKQWASDAWDLAKGVTSDFVDWFVPVLRSAVSTVQGWWDKLRGSLQWSDVRARIDAFIAWVEPVFAATVGFLRALWNFISADAAEAWEKVSRWAGDAWEFISEKAVWLWGVLKDGFNQAKDFIVDNWDTVKTVAVTSFAPILAAAWGAWEGIKLGVETLGGVFKQTFDWIQETVGEFFSFLTDDGTSVWQKVQDAAVFAFVAVEFGLNNFKRIWDLVMTAATLGVVQVIEQVKYLFDAVLPQYLDWFGSNWKDVLTQVWEFSKQVFQNIAENAVEIISKLPDLLSGELSFQDMWKDITNGAAITLRNLPHVAEREIGAAEQALKDQLAALGEELGEDFQKHLEKRFEEIYGFKFQLPGLDDEEAEAAANKAAKQLGKAGKLGGAEFVRQAKSEFGKFDAVLANSAEAITRLQEYKDRLDYGAGGSKASTAGAGQPVARFDAAQRGGSEDAQRQERMEGFLRDIRDATRSTAAREPADVVVSDTGA